MKLKTAFISKVAGAMLALSFAYAGPARAQDNQDSAAQAAAVQNETSQTTPRLTSDWSVAFSPVMPVSLIVGMGGLYGVFCLVAASRRMKGSWLRAGAGGVVVLTLLNPEILKEERELLPTEVTIVVDKSSSQALDGRDSTTTAIYGQILQQLSAMDGVQVRTIEVTDPKGSATLDGTNIFTTLDAGIADVPRDRLGAVILLTDGQVHDVPTGSILPNGIPINAVLSGREGETDRRLVVEQAPRYSLVDKKQTIRFHVTDDGAAPSAPDAKVRVTLSRGGEIVSTLLVTPGESTEIDVDIRNAGSNVFELKAAPLEGELTDVNNRAVAMIEGVRENLNVLLVSGAPSAGVRMWRELLKSDPNNNLIHFTTLRHGYQDSPVPQNELSLIPFPTYELFSEKLNEFDLIIFDHYDNGDDQLAYTYFNNIKNYVKNGGALMVLSGPDYAGQGSLYRTPLGDILPATPTGIVREDGYKPQITDLGQRHPVTRGLDGGANGTDPSWGRWFRMVESASTSGQVIMQGDNNAPLLILNREGEGRVAMLMSDNAWLWARGVEGGGPYVDLLRRTSHWLMRNPTLEEEALNVHAENGNLIIEQQTMQDRNAPVTVRTPAGDSITVTPEQVAPGLWRATVPAEQTGLYSAEQKGLNATISFANVGPANPREFSATLSTPEHLQPVVDAASGTVTRMNDTTGSLVTPRIVAQKDGETPEAGTIPVKMSTASVLKGMSRMSLLPAWAGILLIVGMMAAAWHRESDGKFFGRKKKEEAAPKDNNKPKIQDPAP